MSTVGVDWGGTKLAVGLVAPSGAVTSLDQRPRPQGPYREVLHALVDRIRTARKRAYPQAVGVAVAAWLSPDRRLVLQGVNLGVGEVPLAADLAAATDLPVLVENDANCAGWAEYVAAGRPAGAFVMFTLGTDVGGAVIVNGQLVTGAHGVAGELGHLTVSRAGRLCVCGARGCLATVASGTAITREARRIAAAEPGAGQVMLARAGGDAAAVTGLDVAAGAAAGDRAAVLALRAAGEGIAAAVSQLARVIDPAVVVLGGGAAGFGAPLLDSVTAALAQQPAIGPVRPEPTVLLSHHGRTAGVVGAGLLAASDGNITARPDQPGGSSRHPGASSAAVNVAPPR